MKNYLVTAFRYLTNIVLFEQSFWRPLGRQAASVHHTNSIGLEKCISLLGHNFVYHFKQGPICIAADAACATGASDWECDGPGGGTNGPQMWEESGS